jgi:nucleoside-diphosphate-sugar epimerase
MEDWALAKILITGGAGFIGYHLALALTDKGIHEATLLDNLFRGKMDDDLLELLDRPNIQFLNKDLTKPDALQDLHRDWDYIYHLAAINGTRYFYQVPHEVLRVNILALMHLLDWLAEGFQGKMLFASSSEVYAGTARAFALPIPTPEEVPLTIDDIRNPRLSYAASKIVGELLVINYARKYGFRFSIVRYHNIYGPRMGCDHVIPEFFLRILRREDPFHIYGGQESRAFCFIDDAVEATRLVQETPNADYQLVHIGNSREITICELARLMLQLVKDYAPRIVVREAPQGSVQRRCPDIRKLKELTGFTPSVPLEDGIRRAFEWYKTKGFQEA